MALIKLGTLITDIRGSVGGVVFSRNRSGAIARQRTTPINPKTALQSAIRAILSFVSQLWRTGTTAAQKTDWATYAANVPAKNKLGEVIRLSGFNQFVKSNTVLKAAGIPEIAAAPIVFTLPGEDPTYLTVVSVAAQALAITFDDARAWASEDGAALVVQMGIPQDTSITFFDGPWRAAGAILGAVIPPVTGDPVPVPFPVFAGQQIFSRAKIIRADGRVSDWFRFAVIAGA